MISSIPAIHWDEAQSKLKLKVEATSKKKVVAETKTKAKVNTKTEVKTKPSKKEETKKVTINHIALKTVPFEKLPGWNETDIKKSLIAFQKSCSVFLKQSPSHNVGSRFIHLKAKDWQPVCSEATAIKSITEEKARSFFVKWFRPVELTQRKPLQGTFTGYYMPQLKGSLTRTKEYNVPLYSMPTSGLRRHYTRAQIDHGALKRKADVIAWINSPVERLLLETEGAGVIKLTSGKSLYLGYAGENGRHYTSLSRVMINRGIMTRHNASKNAIIRYFQEHPRNMNSFLHQNKSFVFFENLKEHAALGVEGMSLTPGYSLAIDRRWIPIGSPLWLETKKPLRHSEETKKFNRLVIAQDTGGAIHGLMRGDIYWGSGKNATFLGENMKTKGRFWLLLPKHILDKLIKMY